MVENFDIAGGTDERGIKDGSAIAPAHMRPEHTQIKGRFNQYVSAFWTFVLPLFTTRYLIQPLTDLIGWTDEPKSKPPAKSVSPTRVGISPAAQKYPMLQRSYAIGTGVVMLAATLFYGLKTLGDMRRTLSESLAYEFGKGPKSIGYHDLLFRKTDNNVVTDVRKNFFKYNLRRLAFVNLPFFSFLVPGLRERISTENVVRFGIGSGAAYLVSDVLSRKETFFEELQLFTDLKINQVGRVGEQIKAGDLINLYERNARTYSPHTTFSDKINTTLWNQNMPVFTRMAELMNETYHPHDGNRSDFTTPKFIYLIGHKLIQPENPEQTLAYVEVANRYGIPAVKEMAASLQRGASLDEALQKFPIEQPAVKVNQAEQAAQPVEPQGKFTEQLGDKRGAVKPGAPVGSFVEKTQQGSDSVSAPGVV